MRIAELDRTGHEPMQHSGVCLDRCRTAQALLCSLPCRIDIGQFSIATAHELPVVSV